MKKEEQRYIGFRDVVLIVGLTLLIAIIQVAATMPFSASPFMLAYIAAPVSMIVSGAIFVLLMNKVPYRGTMVLFVFILIVPMLFMGGGFILPCIIFLIGGAIGELVFWKNGTRTPQKLIVAYSVYAVAHGIGTYTPALLTKKAILADLAAQNVPQELIDAYSKLYTVPVILGAVIVTLICAVIGILIGCKIFKKHFARVIG